MKDKKQDGKCVRMTLSDAAGLPVSDVRHRKPGWQTRRLWDAYVPDDRAYRVNGERQGNSDKDVQTKSLSG